MTFDCNHTHVYCKNKIHFWKNLVCPYLQRKLSSNKLNRHWNSVEVSLNLGRPSEADVCCFNVTFRQSEPPTRRYLFNKIHGLGRTMKALLVITIPITPLKLPPSQPSGSNSTAHSSWLVITWKLFPYYWHLVRGIHRWHKGPKIHILGLSLFLSWRSCRTKSYRS